MTTTEPTTSNGTAIGKAVEKVDDSPRALVKKYEDSFAAVLPSHIRVETWVRVAQGALKKGKRLPSGQYELEVAAHNNPGVFLSTLLDAARLGLEPGTEEYYLTPREVKGRLEILGIVGYQGIVELIYRAGAVSSVIVECVFTKDEFVWAPGMIDDQVPPRWAGPMERPLHKIDWDLEDRGELRLVYAYAVMKDKAISKVVVLNKHDIRRIKKSAKGADSKYSPWQTNEPSMWLKSGARQLKKWVPTSAEYIREQLRAVREVQAERPDATLDLPPGVDIDGAASVDDDDFIDAESFEEDAPAYQYAPGEEPFDEGFGP